MTIHEDGLECILIGCVNHPKIMMAAIRKKQWEEECALITKWNIYMSKTILSTLCPLGYLDSVLWALRWSATAVCFYIFVGNRPEMSPNLLTGNR